MTPGGQRPGVAVKHIRDNRVELTNRVERVRDHAVHFARGRHTCPSDALGLTTGELERVDGSIQVGAERQRQSVRDELALELLRLGHERTRRTQQRGVAVRLRHAKYARDMGIHGRNPARRPRNTSQPRPQARARRRLRDHSHAGARRCLRRREPVEGSERGAQLHKSLAGHRR